MEGLMANHLISIQEVSRRVGRCRASIYADIKKGIFPPPLKIGPRSSRWREDEVCAWIEQLPVADLREITTEQ